MKPNLPKYYPRAQFSGILRWSCVFCGHINQDSIRPGTIRLKCGDCERHLFYGMAMHVPANANTKMPKDAVIPSWADTEYAFDTIPTRLFESMPTAFFDPDRKIRQRGRVHVVIIHENIYRSTNLPADAIE